MFLEDFHMGSEEVVTHHFARRAGGVSGGRGEVSEKAVSGARKVEKGGIFGSMGKARL